MDNDETESSESETSEESVSDEYFHDSVESRKEISESFEEHDVNDKIEKDQKLQTDLVLDLRDVPSIANDVKSDDEMSEKLSAVIEQPEDLVISDATVDKTGCHQDSEKSLRERMHRLQELIIDLREQLRHELTLWRKEYDEYQILRERSNIDAVEEATAAARAAAEAYAAESPLSNDLGDVVAPNPVQTLNELTIFDYEKKLATYQDALALAQAEKRYNIRRQSIANSYRQRLVEVERLCNEELEKIRQSANSLQPLKQIASTWRCTDTVENHGDKIHEVASVVAPHKCGKEVSEATRYDQSIYKIVNLDEEVKMIPELIAPRFPTIESSRYDRYAIKENTKASQSHVLIESNSVPSNWYATSSTS